MLLPAFEAIGGGGKVWGQEGFGDLVACLGDVEGEGLPHGEEEGVDAFGEGEHGGGELGGRGGGVGFFFAGHVVLRGWGKVCGGIIADRARWREGARAGRCRGAGDVVW